MTDDAYQPIDIAASGEPAPTVDGPPLVLGRRTFRGLPFALGAHVLAGAGTSASIAVGRSATWLIFAHRLLETQVYAGAMIGGPVAEYVVRYSDGGEERVPIRERFEIGYPDPRWTQVPFAAWWDRDYDLPARLRGDWEHAGLRQAEMRFDADVCWSLFPWPNPRPTVAITTVVVESAGPRFVLGGITASTLDEHPLRVGGPRDILVTLPPTETGEPINGLREMTRVVDATAAADLRVEVDRGRAGYPFAVAAVPPPEDGEVPGWGEPARDRPSPAYVQAAAIPSATVRVALGERELGRVRWSDLEAASASGTGALEPAPGLQIEAVDEGRNWVRTTIVDDATGEPSPCRIHFRSARGIPYQPHGHHGHVNSNMGSWHQDIGGDVRLGALTYAYIDGTCEGWLPRGEVIVDVAHGFETEPLRARVTIAPGQQELRLRLRRWSNLNADGWWSGDIHVHFLSPQGGVTEARGEDLNVVNLLQAQWGSLFTNTEDFTGGPVTSRDGRTIVWVSQENRQHILGHMSLLGLRRPVMPWSSDGLGEAEWAGTLETTMSDWADRAHEQGGTVVTPHFPSPNGETATLVATGRTDAIEMIRHGPYEHGTWYRYLNAGYRLPLVGGTDKMSADTAVGLYRTYVRIPPGEEFSHDAWTRGLRAGRTFHSGGPILRFRVDGREIGDTVDLPAGGGTVEIEASAESIFPIQSLELVHDGQVVAAAESAGPTRRLELRERVRVDRHGWLAVRAGGPGYWASRPHRDSWRRPVFAHTSPVYVAVGGPWERWDPAVGEAMLRLIDGALGYLRDLSPQFDPARVTHHHGQADHMAVLSRPYLEARDAVLRRMTRRGS
ncbi:MAG: hypothetical protein FJ038_03260 [Chloroflexi bacterium]|nr:hypothetical protein [Chloroflexota bacterium]